MKEIISVLIFLVSIGASTVFADELKIIDCRGKTRASRELQSPTESNVSVNVVDSSGLPADGIELSLFNELGQIISALSKDGVAEFPAVPTGVWQLQAKSNNSYFSQIALSDSYVPPFWSGTGEKVIEVAKVIGVVVATVGAALIVHQATKGSGHSNRSGGDGTENGTSPPSTCVACNPDQDAPSIPGFQ